MVIVEKPHGTGFDVTLFSYRCCGRTLERRFGLVHGFTPVSGLSRDNRAKQVMYAFGDSEAAKLHALNSLVKMDEQYVVIHVN